MSKSLTLCGTYENSWIELNLFSSLFKSHLTIEPVNSGFSLTVTKLNMYLIDEGNP